MAHYRDQAGEAVADRLFDAAEDAVERIRKNPRAYHFAHQDWRRIQLRKFPYHFLFYEMEFGVRVMVLRHDRRHPGFGLRRN